MEKNKNMRKKKYVFPIGLYSCISVLEARHFLHLLKGFRSQKTSANHKIPLNKLKKIPFSMGPITLLFTARILNNYLYSKTISPQNLK